MSFEHSIIIPYKLYKRCVVSNDDDDSSIDILTDETLPSDVKLKLYNNSKLGSTTSSSSLSSPEPHIRRGDFILSNIPEKDKSLVRAILDIIDKNKSRIDYNDNLELVLDGEVLPESNLVNVLLYLTRNLPVISDENIPIGSKRSLTILREVGMPTIWIRTPTKRKRKENIPVQEEEEEIIEASLPKRKAKEQAYKKIAQATRWDPLD